MESVSAAREITKAAKISIIGLCAGGILTSMVSAHLSATGQLDQVASLCLGVTLLDMTEAGTTVSLMDEGTAKASMLASRARGYMDGRTLAEVFAWLRPDDLIWNYWVNNYLQGKPPPPFDILYWNADTTRMPAALHRNFIEIAMSNALTKPGAASMLGSPVDLSTIDVDSYVVAGIDDHISPWPSAYRATQLLGSSNIRFVLSNSGHIAAMVNPPSNPKATYRLAPGNPPDHREWLAQAETVQGSWWPDYTAWLADRSGDMKQAPRTLGSAKFRPLGPAPGTLRPSAVSDAARHQVLLFAELDTEPAARVAPFQGAGGGDSEAGSTLQAGGVLYRSSHGDDPGAGTDLAGAARLAAAAGRPSSGRRVLLSCGPISDRWPGSRCQPGGWRRLIRGIRSRVRRCSGLPDVIWPCWRGDFRLCRGAGGAVHRWRKNWQEVGHRG